MQHIMLTDLLRRHRDTILSDWADVVFSSYPEQTARFLRENRDRFRNPVGHAVSRELPRLFDRLVEGGDAADLAGCIDRFIQIRSVQETKASAALAFIYALKRVIRRRLGREAGEGPHWRALEDRIDGLGLAAFDIYLGYREKILEIKANEIRNRSKLLLERMNIGYGDEPGGAGCAALEGIPVEPANGEDAGELKGGND
jgi:hypothetical protein